MQNNMEYMLLQSVLKEHKKNISKQGKRKKDNKNIKHSNGIGTNKISKFKEKYNDRVRSIQNTDSKIEENRRIANEIEKMEKAKMNTEKNYNYDSQKRINLLKDRRSHGRRNK